MRGSTLKDRIEYIYIYINIKGSTNRNKMKENGLRWFGYIHLRPIDATVIDLIVLRLQISLCRGKPKKSWIKIINNNSMTVNQ